MREFQWFYRVLFFLGILCSQWAAGQDARIVLREESTTPLLENFSYFIDETSRLTADDILALDKQGLFKKAESKDIVGTYTHAAYWVKIVVENQTDMREWAIGSVYPIIRFRPYQVLDGKTIPLPANEEFRIPSARLFLEPHGESIFYLRTTTRQIMKLNFYFTPPQDLIRQENEETIFFSIASGCFIAMIVYNFFLFLSLRDRNYLFYIFFAVVNSFLDLMSVSFPREIAHFMGIDWIHSLNFYRPLAPLTTYLFVSSFLQTKRDYPMMHKIFIFYCIGLLALMGGSFILPRETISDIQDSYFLVGILILIFAGFYSLKRGFRPSSYYLAALLSFMAGIIIYLAALVGLVPSNSFTMNAVIVGQVIEMLLMSLALGGKIKELQLERARAQVAAQVKSRLLRVISHDIATPLTVVKSVAHLLRTDKSAGPRMAQITRSVGVIEEIMRFIVKSESLEQGEKLPLEAVSLKAVFENLAFLFQPRAMEKGVRLNFELDNPDLLVLAEKTSLGSEVLGNLLSNAIKFSFPGGEINITARRVDGKTVITVQDHGIGMAPITLQKLFDPVQNRSASGTGGEKGVGFGMPLCKAFVDSYGARITIESCSIDEFPQNSGTTATITFSS